MEGTTGKRIHKMKTDAETWQMPSGSDLAFWRLGRIFNALSRRYKKEDEKKGGERTGSGYRAVIDFLI